MSSNEFKHLGQIDCVVGEPVSVECEHFQESWWYKFIGINGINMNIPKIIKMKINT